MKLTRRELDLLRDVIDEADAYWRDAAHVTCPTAAEAEARGTLMKERRAVLTKLRKAAKLKVYAAEFLGVYMYGDAIVVAENEKQAYALLTDTLIREKLDFEGKRTMTELDTSQPSITILDDGNY